MAGISEAETSARGNVECVLAIGEDKNSKVFEMTFSFNKNIKYNFLEQSKFCKTLFEFQSSLAVNS